MEARSVNQMNEFIDNYNWPQETVKTFKDTLNKQKDNLKLDNIVTHLAKIEISNICHQNFDIFSEISNNEIDKRLNMQRDLMKLAFDLWRDYHFYKRFSFKNRYDSLFEIGLKEMNFILDNDYWSPTTEIDKDVVIKNIQRFILCFSISKQKKMMEPMECSYCEETLHYESMCDSCSAPIMDMIHYQEPEDLSTKKDFWICESCKMCNYFDVLKCGTCQTKGPHFNKWLCDKCHFINHPYDNVCSACYDTNSYLGVCSVCNKLEINSKIEIVCHACKIRRIGDYMCQNPENHKVYGDVNYSCSKCGIPPITPPTINETLPITDANNKVIEMWKCTFCREYNEVDQDKCIYCLNYFYCEPRKLCVFCGSVSYNHRKNSCPKCTKRFAKEKNCFIM